MNRRRLLAALGSLGGVAAIAAAHRWLPRHTDSGPDWWNRLRWHSGMPVTLPPGRPGPLAPETLSALLLLPATMFGRVTGTDHYRRFFLYRATSVAGYGRLYRSLVQELDGGARASGNTTFASLDPESRRQVLLGAGIPPRRPSRRELSTLPLQLARYERFVTREVVDLFNSTDAWVLAGHRYWPGQPRGLEYYLQPVRETTPSA